MNKSLILDVTCANRSIWFNKHHPNAVYCDIREEHIEQRFGTNQSLHTIDIKPDVVCDFTDLPFDDNSFALVVFDPPHIASLSSKSWLSKHYGVLVGEWKEVIGNGFKECMRVLRPEGVLILKWADTSVSTPDLIKVIGEPLFGHRSGKKMGTHWLTFMKLSSKCEEKQRTGDNPHIETATKPTMAGAFDEFFAEFGFVPVVPIVRVDDYNRQHDGF